jgi:hypothetical protein
MKFQTAMSANLAESIFRSAVSGITATNTDAALTLGEPVILATATIGVGPTGQEVIRALTVTNVTLNRLLVGSVASATIAHEGVGLVQVYGVGTVRLKEAATVAAGDKLVPDLNTTATALTSSGRGAWIARTVTDTDINFSSGAAVIAVAAGTAVSGTAGVTNGSAFIRAL